MPNPPIHLGVDLHLCTHIVWITTLDLQIESRCEDNQIILL